MRPGSGLCGRPGAVTSPKEEQLNNGKVAASVTTADVLALLARRGR